jgi:hypothetical protein
MGTRRSRHNKGRKPLYKEHRLTAAELLERPMYGNGGRYDTFTHWSEEADARLTTLALAQIDLPRAADIVGRRESTLVSRAREMRLPLPSDWSKLLARPKKPPLLKPQELQLSYPYIRKPRDEHALLLGVNAIIPKTLLAAMRADICQDVILAILEGEISLEGLRREPKSARWFINNFWTKNHEASGHASSLDEFGKNGQNNQDAFSYADARDWVAGKRMQDQSGAMLRKFFEPPAQEDHLFVSQLEEIHMKRHMGGDLISFAELVEELS